MDENRDDVGGSERCPSSTRMPAVDGYKYRPTRAAPRTSGGICPPLPSVPRNASLESSESSTASPFPFLPRIRHPRELPSPPLKY
jgi:hypothetical protein